MTEKMLAILLCRIDNASSIGRRCGSSDELFRIRKEMSPLREEKVDNTEIFTLCLGMRTLCRQEMDVRVAAEIAFSVHITPPL